MVDYDQKGVKTIQKWEVSDQIARDLLKGARARGRDGGKWGSRRVSIDLVLLARGTAVYIAANEGSKARPPKFRGNKLMSFKNARVASSRVVMMAGNHRSAKVCICRNVNMILKSEDTHIIVPVGEP